MIFGSSWPLLESISQALAKPVAHFLTPVVAVFIVLADQEKNSWRSRFLVFAT
jgi:hypothetical protein